MIKTPKLLDVPTKLLPLITEFDNYRYFLIEGGRGSSKTNTIARLLLYIAELYSVRIVCGRETQKSIDESVYMILSDLIRDFNLNFKVQKAKIESDGSEIRFKGFREQGSVNIKGLEGVDILWVDEAESLTKPTIDVIVPTIRKPNSKIIFSMNRFVRDDPAYTLFVNRPDCLHIHIDYFENEFCPEVLINEAEECKSRNERDYNHIWLGQPLDRADNYLFSVEKLDKCKTIEPIGDLYKRQTVMGIDLAASGGDSCVASILERVSNVHWELKTQEAWTESNTMASVGKVVGFIGKYKPDIIVVDAGGLGLPMYDRMRELGINNLFGFNGATTDGIALNAGNARADGYLTFNEFLDNDWLIIKSEQTLKEMETIQLSPHRHSNGRIYIKSKQDMKSEGIHSPDKADSVMMAIFGIKKWLGKINYSDRAASFNYKRTNTRAQFRERTA